MSGLATPDIEHRLVRVGHKLGAGLRRLIDALPDAAHGPTKLASSLGIDKVVASRVLRAAAKHEPIAFLRAVPGPEPLRRVMRAAAARGVPVGLVADVEAAIGEFDRLISTEAGDRSALDAILSAWLPDARAEFELRRKQAAFRAMSELLGHAADTFYTAGFMHPSAGGQHWDVVFLFAFLGLRRLRPRSTVKVATRRFGEPHVTRRPCTLDRTAVDDLEHLILKDYCSQPLPNLQVQRHGEATHYLLGDAPFGAAESSDIVFAELNPELMPAPKEPSKRKRGAYAEARPPARRLVFDLFLEQSIQPPSAPELHIYDTTSEGVADINDPARDIDRLELQEHITPLGRGLDGIRSNDVPHGATLARLVCSKLGWDPDQFGGYRCRIEYPLYGTQVAMAFDTVARPPVDIQAQP